MNSEQQYMDLFTANRELIDRNSAAAMNALREQAFADFARLGFPTRKVERYKYTDVAEAFAPDYGVNLKRVEFAVNPYEAFRCDVPNLSTSLYFMLNDAFWEKALPRQPCRRAWWCAPCVGRPRNSRRRWRPAMAGWPARGRTR